MLDNETREALRAALKNGTLKARTVDPLSGEVSDQPITAVLRHHTPHKTLVRVTLDSGESVTCTEDHSLFEPHGDGVAPVAAGSIRLGSAIVTVRDGKATFESVASALHLPPEDYTYDLSVPGPQNFMLSNGVLAHNSYSIGGISLDIEKSSKYESLKSNAEGQFDKATEAKARTVKFIRGLQQPKYGVGIRSSFGPAVGRGVLSPRSFL